MFLNNEDEDDDDDDDGDSVAAKETTGDWNGRNIQLLHTTITIELYRFVFFFLRCWLLMFCYNQQNKFFLINKLGFHNR